MTHVPTRSITVNLDEVLRLIHYVYLTYHHEGEQEVDKSIWPKLRQARDELKEELRAATRLIADRREPKFDGE